MKIFPVFRYFCISETQMRHFGFVLLFPLCKQRKWSFASIFPDTHSSEVWSQVWDTGHPTSIAHYASRSWPSCLMVFGGTAICHMVQDYYHGPWVLSSVDWPPGYNRCLNLLVLLWTNNCSSWSQPLTVARTISHHAEEDFSTYRSLERYSQGVQSPEIPATCSMGFKKLKKKKIF